MPWAARQLLCDATALLDAHPRLLRAAGPVRSFHDGARWMRLVLRTVRGQRLERLRRSLEWVAFRKYALCAGCTLALAYTLAYCRLRWLLPICVPYFYLLEVQRVFDMPLAIDGLDRRSRHAKLLQTSGGVHRAVWIVMAIAGRMVFGGFAGKGYVRSWCVGCAAVVLWYERARAACATAACRQESFRLERWWWDRGFELGAAGPILLRHEHVSMPSARPTRLLYLSDLHLGNRWSMHVVLELTRHAEGSRPDAIFLGGDLADTAAGLRALTMLAGALRATSPTVVAVLGNHDRWAEGRRIQNVLAEHGIQRLRQPLTLPTGIDLIAAPDQAAEPDRSVLCAHDPAVYPYARERNIRLTLAGHLHGGQCVLWNRGTQQWPGWLINRWTITRRDDPRSTLIVSRGAADTLPIRFNCPREVVLVTLVPRN